MQADHEVNISTSTFNMTKRKWRRTWWATPEPQMELKNCDTCWVKLLRKSKQRFFRWKEDKWGPPPSNNVAQLQRGWIFNILNLFIILPFTFLFCFNCLSPNYSQTVALLLFYELLSDLKSIFCQMLSKTSKTQDQTGTAERNMAVKQ